jgi:2-polyprenyl-3-methyl-5-hydroxy-6-metoxy-1,4-benzoquinol methylase
MQPEPLNKTMDREDLKVPQCRPIVEELWDLMRWMHARDLRYSSWIGTLEPDPLRDRIERINRGPDYEPLEGAYDDEHWPWFRLWEASWLSTGAALEPGMRALDLGGSGSLFSSYLASRGLEVTTIDINPRLVSEANRVAEETGWTLKAIEMDMSEMEFEPESFDRVFSVCVYEHLPRELRIKTNRRVRHILRPGGLFCISFDYQNPEPSMSIRTPEDVQEQFVEPLGLPVMGNQRLFDNGKRYLFHPWFADPWTRFKRVAKRRLPLSCLWSNRMAYYTFAALFCRKPPA